MPHAPGKIRDSIIGSLSRLGGVASIAEIQSEVAKRLGPVPASSVRSYLNDNSPKLFERVSRGRYKLRTHRQPRSNKYRFSPAAAVGKSRLYNANCFEWLGAQEAASFHAVITDPPYGLIEYTPQELKKLRMGRGGIWRIPPSFDGHQRSPLPRFATLDANDRQDLHDFFAEFGALVRRVLVPGANIVVASNPLLSHIVASAMVAQGFELRGTIIRLVMTMRGGDRPKNAHEEFADVSVMPRSMWEPWVVLRRPLEGRVQDNLRRWKTGGFRRPSPDKPFGDVIRSSPARGREREIAPHPSLKPQAFLRQIVHASLPLGEGIVLDPFAGAGSTLAAANAVGYQSVGVEVDPHYTRIAAKAIGRLSAIKTG